MNTTLSSPKVCTNIMECDSPKRTYEVNGFTVYECQRCGHTNAQKSQTMGNKRTICVDGLLVLYAENNHPNQNAQDSCHRDD